ncbi:MAG: zinc-ribbon domain-containing protein [Lachnospiraceae bacterium]|nr:zinc-ribbon domain-containing protein [Lachnospiraceae bacterium]
MKKIALRTSGAGCSACLRARRTSFPEQCFYYYTKKLYPDSINSYKEIFDNQMELDIYIPSLKTGIEYDGVFWHGKSRKSAQSREEKKYRICKENQIRLFRIKEGEFAGFTETADRAWYVPPKYDYQTLNYYITIYLKALSWDGKRIPVVNVERDKAEILEYRTLPFEDSLAFLYPEIAKDWHPTKNGHVTPDLFVPGSGEKVWWLCSECGNEWPAIIVNRVKGHGCDRCATTRRKATKKRTLLTERGCLDKEWCLLDWDYEENEYGPEHYTNGSGEVVGWCCHICGHKWPAAICDRTRDYRNGCPLCSRKVVVSGVNDLCTLKPELMKEWDYTKNMGIDPTKVGVGSRLYASWNCNKCGYGWDAQIYNRANGKGCPCCANRVVVPGINDLATTDPELAREWHPTLNKLKATEVTRGQSKKGYWICSKCKNVWQDTLNHRSGGRGCSKCKKR